AADVRFGSQAEIPTCPASRPLHPWKRTSRSRRLTSATGQERTHALQQIWGHRNLLSVVQLIEQRLGLLQTGCIKSFGEPPVDRSEKITGLAALVLFAPEARQADRCPEFKELCALEHRYRECPVIAPLRRGRIAYGIQQIASHQMQRSLVIPFVGRLDDL